MYAWFKFQVKSDKGASYLDIIVTLCSIRYCLLYMPWHMLLVPYLYIMPLRFLPLEKYSFHEVVYRTHNNKQTGFTRERRRKSKNSAMAITFLICLRHFDPEMKCAYFQWVDMSFVNRIRPDPGFVSPVRSNPGFVSPIRSRFCQRQI